ncbi:hypothetical protein C8Q79DRAFT_500650 [Trametes meyenii]|nr:hypothetical protein C8Q79DRAFT_500650 [Trametes meyenii]
MGSAHILLIFCTMSVATAERAIIPALWPDVLKAIASAGYDRQVRDDWKFIPDSIEAMYDWATVLKARDDEDSRDGSPISIRHLVYTSDAMPEEDAPCNVTVVLQGFVSKCSLGVLGNWRGKERDAPAAVQYILLESNGCDVPFDAQRRALTNIREFITLLIGNESEGTPPDSDKIMLRKRVFKRVRPTDNPEDIVKLNDGNDPYGSARKISSKWRIGHSTTTFIRRSTGANLAVAAEVIRPGDFVEVTATASIEVLRTCRRRGTNVHFEMHEVVRLMSAKDVKSVYATTCIEHGGAGREPRIVNISRVRGGIAGGEGSGRDRDVEMAGNGNRV